MARILITSGPTRQYIDPVRFISNASSGQMGANLAQAALDLGHEVIVVSGPVQVEYPSGSRVVQVVTTQEMLQAATEIFDRCDGVIGAAAPCDYQPVEVASHKLRKTGEPLQLKLIETPDVLATLGQNKRKNQWVVGFALETDDARFRALAKLERKCCDLVVLNGVAAINSNQNEIELIAPSGEVVAAISGDKPYVAAQILAQIEQRLLGMRNEE